jgi:UDP-GlcNAc3NAcA epimerase
VITDSGGVQKEAYLLGVPCITLRDTTEWVETVTANWNILVGADQTKIQDAIRNFFPPRYRPKIFGPSGASARIAKIVDSYLSNLDVAT